MDRQVAEQGVYPPVEDFSAQEQAWRSSSPERDGVGVHTQQGLWEHFDSRWIE